MVCVMGFVDSRAPNRVRAKLRKTVGDTSPTVLKLGTSSLQETVLTDHRSVRLKWFELIVSFWSFFRCHLAYTNVKTSLLSAKLRKTVGDTSPTVLKLGTSSLQETVLTDHRSVRLKWFEPIFSFWLRVIAISVYTRQLLSIAMSWKIHHRQIYCIFRRFGGVRVVTIT